MKSPADNLNARAKGGGADVSSAPHLRLLMIEDNPGDARLIQEMLKDACRDGFVFERTDRLDSGMQRLEEGGIDVVLLDLSLPDSQGLQTFSKLHSHFPKMPIIVMSGLDDETVAVQAVHEGAQDYLVKGHVDGYLLLRAIRYAIERKRTAEQLAQYAEELRQKNALMEADLNMAREIQQVFLPDEYPTFPKDADPGESLLRFHHRYQPAASVSGDFFTVIPVSDTAAGVLICDVMGHGLRAALVTAIMRGLVEELMPVAQDPGKFLTAINQSLLTILQRTDVPMLVTAFYLIADVGRNEVRFASAGHPSPFRVQRAKGEVEALKCYDSRHGPALGLFDASAYPSCSCPLEADDLIILFTDGLHEVIGADDEEFGMDRLLEAVRKRSSLPPRRLFDELIEEVRAFSQVKEFEDDICLVAIERTGAETAASTNRLAGLKGEPEGRDRKVSSDLDHAGLVESPA